MQMTGHETVLVAKTRLINCSQSRNERREQRGYSRRSCKTRSVQPQKINKKFEIVHTET